MFEMKSAWGKKQIPELVALSYLDNVNVLIQKQCYNLKLRIEGSNNRVFKFIFDLCSFKASKLFAKSRDSIEVPRV